MRRIAVVAAALLMLAGCDKWGDYKYESEKFKFKMTFPERWEVWDKSDDSRDYIVANLPDKPDSKIEVSVVRTAPDLHVNELYPTFESGGDDPSQLTEFGVDDKASVSAANGEGRMIKVHWTGERAKMKGIRFLFVGNRYVMNVRAEMSEDDFLTNEPEFLKMAHRIQL